jgi:hypothetical protein
MSKGNRSGDRRSSKIDPGGSMRKRAISLFIGVALALALAAPVAADTGGEADLGLDAIAITSVAVDTRSGAATVHGAVVCSADIEGYAGVELRQTIGRFFTVGGWGDGWFSCSAATGSAAFHVVVQPYEGKFGGGPATAYAYAETVQCSDAEEDPDCMFDVVQNGPTVVRLGGRR